MDRSSNKTEYDTGKIIIEALKMYRNQQQVVRSNTALQMRDAVQEDFTVNTLRSIYAGGQESTQTTDSSQYLSDIRQHNGLRDTSLIPSQAQQSPLHLRYPGIQGNTDFAAGLAGFAAAGNSSNSINVLPKSLKEFLESNTSKFQESPMMASAREEPQHRMVNKIPDELVCALCGEMYNDPRLLPCLHTFCRRCLEHTVNPRSATITCHSCRKEVSLMVRYIFFPSLMSTFELNSYLTIHVSDF